MPGTTPICSTLWRRWPPAMTERVDLVILGGGLAGLALAERLARAGTGGQVRVIEPREHYEDDRSWAFWTPIGSAWAARANRTWARWCSALRGAPPVMSSAEGWCYAQVRSADVYAAATEAIATSPHVQLRSGIRAESLRATDDGVDVYTSAGTVRARHVVDTRPPSATRFAASPLFQSFAGRELALDGPGVDDRAVELMTDMRADARGFAFAYVLPISRTRVLVEATRFAARPMSAGELAADLDALVAARGWAHAPVLRTEQAVLPMGLPPASDEPLRGVVRAGTSAGALRAASGYGFLRIQAWASRCAAAIAADGPPIGHPVEPRLRRWMDAVFLHAVASNPAHAPVFFMRLATAVPPASLVRFLSDQATPIDLARIVTALPPWPFLRALGPGLMAAGRAA
jgi:lycopene beta-cyclase